MKTHIPLDRTELKQIRNYIIDKLEMDEVESNGDDVLELATRKFEDRYPLEDSQILSQVRYLVEDVLREFVVVEV